MGLRAEEGFGRVPRHSSESHGRFGKTPWEQEEPGWVGDDVSAPPHGLSVGFFSIRAQRPEHPEPEPEHMNDKTHPGFHRLCLAAVKGAGKNRECCHEREKMKSSVGVLKYVHKLFDTPFCKRWSHLPPFQSGLDLVTSFQGIECSRRVSV